MPLKGEAKKQYMKKYHSAQKLNEGHSLNLEAKSVGEQTLEDFKKSVELDEKGEVPVGEVKTYLDLCKIFYGNVDDDNDEDEVRSKKKKVKKIKKKAVVVFDKEILGKTVSFFEWLEIRRNHRSNFALLCNTARGSWSEKAHGPVFKFFGDLDNSMLLPGYTEDDFKKFLLAQGEVTQFLLLYPRAFRKSTISILDCINWILNGHGDIVILIITSTNLLGTKFVYEVRKYFEVLDYDRPTNFQLIFPEHCVPEGYGDQRSFRSPVARLGLKDPTLSVKSMESKGFAGTRAHIIKFDDCVDEENWKTPKSRQDVFEKHAAACQLIERPYGRIYVVGTRWTDGLPDDSPNGSIPDMYGAIIQRNEKSKLSTARFKSLIAGAWIVKDQALDKELLELKEEDVDLLYPGEGPGSWESLQAILEDFGQMSFECQQLNRPVMKLESDYYVNNFTEELFSSSLQDISHTAGKTGRSFVFVDTANSLRKQADSTAMVNVLIEDCANGDTLAYARSFEYGHWKSSEICQRVVAFSKKWNAQCIIVEEIASITDLFKKDMREQMRIQDAGLIPTRWDKTDTNAKAKEVRIKALETLFASGRLKIMIGPGTNAVHWIDELKKQLLGYTGHHTNKNHIGGRHDDLPDCLSFIYKVMNIGVRTPDDEESQKKMEEEVARKQQYDRYFGNDILQSSTLLKPQEDEQVNPLHRALNMIPKKVGPVLSFWNLRRKTGTDGND